MDKEEIIKIIDQKIKVAFEEFEKKLKQKGGAELLVDKKEKAANFISLQQFINEKNPRPVASEEMPAIAYYLREIDERKIIEVDEEIMIASYKKTDRIRPKRINQAFIDSSFFTKITQKKGFYKLNYDGDYFVEVTLKERKRK